MNVEGWNVTPEAEKAALDRMTSGAFRARDVTLAVAGLVPPNVSASRVADRIIQRERKAGHIRFKGATGVWTWRTPL